MLIHKSLAAAAFALGLSVSLPALAQQVPPVPGAILTDDLSKICVRGYSRSIRPPESVTEKYKRRLFDMSLAASVGDRMSDFELDDKVPIELGGRPGPLNYWLQPIIEAHAKDREEDQFHRSVCSAYRQHDPQAHQMLLDAQDYFLNWPGGTAE